MNYLFIDGAYLTEEYNEQMKAFYEVGPPPIQFNLLATHCGADRTYYYDAIAYMKLPNESDEARDARIKPKQDLHEYISSQSGFHVREGHVRRRPRKKTQEQKAVDVQLAVDALEHAARDNMQTAAFLTGDLDFEPLLHSLARLGVHTKLFYSPRSAALELRQAADDVHEITLEHFWKWAAPSFQANYRQVTLSYNQSPPDANFKVERHGSWKNRKVLLASAITDGPGAVIPSRLFVERGKELTEPSRTFEYGEIAKLELAFKLTFGGDITWD